MKVLFININGYQLPYARVRCYNFARILKKYGVNTEVLSYQDHLAPEYDGIQMLELSDREKLRLNFKAFLRIFRKKDTIFYLQKIHYHIASAYLLYRLGENRFILDYDDWDIDRSPLFNNKYFNRIFFRTNDCEKLTHRIANEAELCIVSSNYLYQYLFKYNPNTYLIPTGVDTHIFKPNKNISDNNKVTFIWTGQVWGEVIYNNVIFLLECFNEVSKRYDNVKFKIIGGGQFYPNLKEYVNQRLNSLDIKFIDWINPDEMPEYLSKADIGLMPLIPDGRNKEWMKAKSPTKLFEYMASGLVSIATRYGEVEFIIEDGKDGFLATNKQEFIDKMLLAARNKQLRSKIGKKAREKAVKKYSLEYLGEKLFELISKIK